MKKILLVFTFLLFLSFTVKPTQAKISYSEILEKHKGKVIYVDFWAS